MLPMPTQMRHIPRDHHYIPAWKIPKEDSHVIPFLFL